MTTVTVDVINILPPEIEAANAEARARTELLRAQVARENLQNFEAGLSYQQNMPLAVSAAQKPDAPAKPALAATDWGRDQ